MSADPGNAERPQWWGLLVEENVRTGRARWWDARLVGEHYGTHEEAIQALWPFVRGHKPVFPRRIERRQVFREESGYLALFTGAMGTSYPCRFVARELVWDSGERSSPPLGPV
ncbi:hypothetical protein ACWGIB_04805 [Streptomyces xiamenensis]